MDKHELLEREFNLKRCTYEERQDEIRVQRDQGFKELDNLADVTQYYLKDYVTNHEYISQTFRKIGNMKEEIREFAKNKIGEIDRDIENLEGNYRGDVDKLVIQDASKKGGGSTW